MPTRQDAVRQGAGGDAQVGVREWLDRAPRLDGTAAAAFDTKIDKPVPGSAAHRVHRRLRRLGGRMLVSAETFRVTDTAGPLVDGERERARRWGETVGEVAAAGAYRI
jgi:hypothetical protein